LPRSLERFIDYQQRVDLVRGKLVSAAIYPCILLLVGGGVSLFLIGYVVPRFAEVYQGAGRNLPWMSQLMLSWGQFAAAHTAPLLGGIAALAGGAVLGVRRLVRSGGLARLLRSLPGVGERVRIYELSRLYLTLGMLSEGGITILHAIDTVQGMVSANVKQGLQGARAMIEAGLPLSSAFEANGLTTPISLRMLRVGERTGEMGAMLTQSAAFYDGEISRWIDRFTRTFEPLLMAGIGLVVGAIVVLLYMPIFDLAGEMS
jgi:general secretion pathway protein F